MKRLVEMYNTPLAEESRGSLVFVLSWGKTKWGGEV